MRKDSRVGMAIGGVLVAVLIVYAVVVPKTNSNTKKKVTLDTTGQLAAPVGDPSAGSGTQAGTSDASSAQPTDKSAATIGAADKNAGGATADASAEPKDPTPANGGSATNWAALLASDHVDASALRTRTPDPALPDGISTAGSSESANTPITNGTSRLLAPATRPSNAVAAGTHRVAAGETFSSIAQSVYGNSRYASKIAKANPNIDPRRLRPGMTIRLPGKSDATADSSSAAEGPHTGKAEKGLVKVVSDSKTEYAVQNGDSLYYIAKKLYGRGDKAHDLYELNKSVIGPNEHNLKVGMVLKLPQAPTAAR